MEKGSKDVVPQEIIKKRIFLIRSKRVLLDRDIASLYGISTKVLNQAVKRNSKRFPEDFMFQLNQEEKEKLVTNCDRFRTLKHSSSMPYVFTEQGVAMLSSVLNSESAIQVNIAIMRAFVKLREIVSANKAWASKLFSLEKKIMQHDGDIKSIYTIIKELMSSKQLFQTNIKGNIGNLSIGSQRGVMQIRRDDLESLKQYLRAKGIIEKDLKELEELILKEKKFGDKVKAWCKKMVFKSLKGTGKIASNVAENILKEAISKYFGL